MPLLVADLASEYGIRLYNETAMLWDEFRTLVYGLLQQPNSRLWRATQPPPENPS